MTKQNQQAKTLKAGYLYVLTHPARPDLYKIGVTIRSLDKRVAEHNHEAETYTGRLVKETGQKWELKMCFSVPDPYWAEKFFWDATPFSLIPFLGGVEVQKMTWEQVEKGLAAAIKAGVRPPEPLRSQVRNRDWMQQQLKGTGIAMISPYQGLVRFVRFQCQNGHVFEESPGVVANRKSCPCCVDWNWRSGPRKGLRATL